MSHPVHEDSDRLLAAQRSDDFVLLKKRFRAFVFPMTLVFLGWYLLYVIASGWARGFMGQELWGNYPQTYSLVGMINCAVLLSKPWSSIR